MFLLAACKPSAPAAQTETPDANAVFTAAAQTASAHLTETAAVTPTPPPATPTDTSEPPTAAPVSETPTIEAANPTSTSAVSLPGGDKAQFVSDVTVPDGSDYQPGAAFVKTWQIKNVGTTTWTKDYALAFVGGDQMSGPASVSMPSEVAPGQTVNISVDLKAPADVGSYTGYWRPRNANGQLFDTSIYVQIDVVGSGTPIATSTPGTATITGTVSATSTGTPVPSATPKVETAVTSAAIAVQGNNVVEGQCPQTFTFLAQFTTSQQATVTYQLEAGSDDPTYVFSLPEPETKTLEKGTHPLSYTLSFTSSINGWARLHVTAPNEVISNQVDFTLTCTNSP